MTLCVAVRSRQQANEGSNAHPTEISNRAFSMAFCELFSTEGHAALTGQPLVQLMAAPLGMR
jgi:hypothetical protein